ncbi:MULTISPECIES: hypothetical protein [unclassified Bacillus cereus group]|uniref:hypothetical protein n=1 Tax=unclassified Bacillus cereus group TaxID=2750818 RepID=UPI001F57968C|nr:MULTISPECIES: hypothetical protein [unclassified Bacillus cereus group]
MSVTFIKLLQMKCIGKGFLTVTDAPSEVSLNHGFYVNTGAIKSCIDLFLERKEAELKQ